VAKIKIRNGIKNVDNAILTSHRENALTTKDRDRLLGDLSTLVEDFEKEEMELHQELGKLRYRFNDRLSGIFLDLERSIMRTRIQGA